MSTTQPSPEAMQAAREIEHPFRDPRPMTVARIAEIIDAAFRSLRDENRRLRDSLQHMQWCRDCGEGSWEDCEGGRQAIAALAATTGEQVT